jgi:1-acylglycerone phosphate reductase
VQSDIYTKPGDFKLPPKSIYERILSTIRDAAEGTLDPEMMPAEKYAERVLDDVLKGMSGKVYRGNVASVTRVMSWLPSMILVSEDTFLGTE